MTTLALALAVSVLLSRLPVLMNDRSLRGWEVFASWAFQWAAACFLMTWFKEHVWIGIVMILVHALVHVGWYLKERSMTADRQLLRLGTVVLLLLMATALGSPWTGAAVRDHSPWLTLAANWFTPSALLAQAAWRNILVTAFGLLLCLNEANALIRWGLERMNLKPKEVPPGACHGASGASGAAPEAGGGSPAASLASPGHDPIEYKRGRLIGVLERLIVFVLVLNAQYAAVAFVLTAKSMARFKSLDDRDFAEYFLLGTLMSVVLAGCLALIVRHVT